MTTALVLFCLGAFLEYSKRVDFLNLIITVACIGAKAVYGVYQYQKYRYGKSSFYENFYAHIPYELVFALSNSVKYTQTIFMAKWLERN